MARPFEGIVDAIPHGVAVLDTEGRVEFLNPEACRILETSTESSVGRPIEGLVGSGHGIARLARAVLAAERPIVEHEHALDRRLGEDLVLDVSGAPLFGEGRQGDGVVLVLSDRRIAGSLQALVSERQSLSAFERIAAGIAHEVRNPLGGIRGAAEILSNRAADTKTRDAAELIVREVDRIAGLVDELMEFTRGDELTPVGLNIHRVLDQVLELLALDPAREGIELQRVFDPSLPEIRADAARLTQVFLNLCRNALQAMDGSGTLRITTRTSFDQRLPAEDGESLPALLVEIADTGTGIAAEHLEHLTTPFFTTRPRGTGLGLAVCRHWVSRHGGTLRIESQAGRGTTVRVALPLRRSS